MGFLMGFHWPITVIIDFNWIINPWIFMGQTQTSGISWGFHADRPRIGGCGLLGFDRPPWERWFRRRPNSGLPAAGKWPQCFAQMELWMKNSKMEQVYPTVAWNGGCSRSTFLFRFGCDNLIGADWDLNAWWPGQLLSLGVWLLYLWTDLKWLL